MNFKQQAALEILKALIQTPEGIAFTPTELANRAWEYAQALKNTEPTESPTASGAQYDPRSLRVIT